MTIKEFQELSKHEQIQVIKEHGVFLADRVVSGNRLFLYIVNTFYVELLHEFSNINSKGIVITRAFDNESELADYTDKTDASRPIRK
ncbi:hypothetical protein FAM09_11465 [Niastella caeni]|uniref:Uncharacterized protein n=1 Tax=Niastella caeni TaxID=2569763 RepID=A0A4S8I362_9BACT|nr:hypothetical protein [Niastella caeni]THU40472.1 hypothetical protein FAM09_11465 [Niastella caeni]